MGIPVSQMDNINVSENLYYWIALLVISIELQGKNMIMQDKEQKINKEVLFRYLKCSASDEDKNILLQGLDNTKTEHELNEESFRFWEDIDPDMNIQGYNGDHILDRIHHNIKIEEGTFLNKTNLRFGLVRYLTRIAAILFVPVFIASLLFYFQNKSFRNSLAWAEIHAPYGTRTDFFLPDGSTGRLNGGSSLKFPVQFTGNVRGVKLTGEAYFNVVSNHRKPFVVSAKNIDIKATGTSFNVMAYADEPNTEVILKKGEVEVFEKLKETITSMGVLKPEESFIYNSLADSCKIQPVNSEDKLSWLEGKLTFKYEPFEEVVRMLNRWYNVNIVIKDKPLDSYIYYGTFQNETLDEVLKLLQYTAPIRYKDYERKMKHDGSFEKRRIEIYCKR